MPNAPQSDTWSVAHPANTPSDSTALVARLRGSAAGTGDIATADMRLHDEAADRIAAQEARIAELTQQRNFQCARKLEFVQRVETLERELAAAKRALGMAQQVMHWYKWNDPTECRDRGCIEAQASDAIDSALAAPAAKAEEGNG